MRITLDTDAVEHMQPTSVNWQDPVFLGNNGLGSPVYSPYRNCSLGFDRMTLVQFQHWGDAVDGLTHSVRLPHPETGVLTQFTGVFVSQFSPRLNVRDDCDAAAAGVDILLTRILVT